MPKRVGVREFKQRASEILREVREAGVAYDVTYRGEVIASLVPARKPERPMTIEEWNAAADELAARLEAEPIVEKYRNMSAVDMVREGRDRDEYVLQYRPTRHRKSQRPTP